MAIIQLPLREDGNTNYFFKTELEGIFYGFGIRFNVRTSLWSMSIEDIDQVPIVTDVAMLMQASLIERYRDTRLPPGRLFMVDIDNPNQDPGRDDLGKTAFLLYDEKN